jgi:two-component system, LytTR family, response regulator
MLNVAIVDDEAPARKRLRKLLEPFVGAGRIQIAIEATDGLEAVDLLKESNVDLLFLDIRMPELSGFETLERIKPDERPLVVFTTAYDSHALKAFEANAIDYLLKPVSTERLQEAVSRAERMKGVLERRPTEDARLAKLLDWVDAQSEQRIGPPSQRPQEYLKQLSIPFRDRILILPISKIISAEIHEGVTRLYVLDEEHPGGPKTRLKQHIVTHTLDQLEQNLDPDHFMRVHRSAIVQISHIVEMIAWFSGRYKLVLTGGHEVIASRERSKVLKDRLMI